jgi:hypothetical protein
MIQLIDLMILFVGLYIVTRMVIYVFQEDVKMHKLGIFITKMMAIITIVVTIACVALAMLSFV